MERLTGTEIKKIVNAGLGQEHTSRPRFSGHCSPQQSQLLLGVGVGSPPAAAQVFCAEVTRADRDFIPSQLPAALIPACFCWRCTSPFPGHGPGEAQGTPWDPRTSFPDHSSLQRKPSKGAKRSQVALHACCVFPRGHLEEARTLPQPWLIGETDNNQNPSLSENSPVQLHLQTASALAGSAILRGREEKKSCFLGYF